MGIGENIVNTKQSTYNSKIILDKCMICKSEVEEVHHIEEQHLLIKMVLSIIYKNNLFNLEQLCQKCHHDVHHGNLY